MDNRSERRIADAKKLVFTDYGAKRLFTLAVAVNEDPEIRSYSLKKLALMSYESWGDLIRRVADRECEEVSPDDEGVVMAMVVGIRFGANLAIKELGRGDTTK